MDSGTFIADTRPGARPGDTIWVPGYDDDLLVAATDADDADTIAAPPSINRDAVLVGLVGDIATAAADGREVSPVAVAAATLTWLGCEYGRDAYLPIGDSRHHGRIYLTHIGRSARAGKGEALALLRRIRREIDTYWAGGNILGQMHDGGLSSREGLVHLIHDGYKSGKEEVPAIDDKRLLVVEEELGQVLAQGKREGNTLLPALRTAYDGHTMAPATKHERISAKAPHVCILGAITPGELVSRIEAREVLGGTHNRFAWLWAERTCMVPLPGPTDAATVRALAERCVEAILWARGQYPATQDSREMTLSPEARETWGRAYPTLRRPLPGEIPAAAGERRATIALRFAVVYALTDRTLEIQDHHVQAGIEWARYSGETIRYVLSQFAAPDGEDDERQAKLLAYLAERDWTARTAIRRECYGGRIDRTDLDAVLTGLLDAGRIERREIRHPDNPAVRTEYRRAAQPRPSAHSAHNAHNQQPQGPALCAGLRTTAHNEDVGQGDPSRCARSAQDCAQREPNNGAGVRVVRAVRIAPPAAHNEDATDSKAEVRV